MSFKKIRYNLIVIGLVALVCCYIGMGLFFTQSSSNANNGGSAQEEPIEDPTNPEDPDLPIDNGDEDDGDEDVDLPSDAIELINYGLDILNNGTGYESTFSSTIVNTPLSDALKGIQPTQNLTSVISRGVNSKGEKVGIQKDYYYSNYSGTGDGMLARYFRGFYDNQATGQVNIIETKDYSYTAKTYNVAAAYRNETKDINNVIDEFKVLYTQDYPIKLTKKNCMIIKDDSKKSKTYRTITVSINNFASLSENFLKFYTSTNQMKDISYKKIEMSFVINKNTGYISKIRRNELLHSTAINVPALGTMAVQSAITIEQSFTKVNKNVILADNL